MVQYGDCKMTFLSWVICDSSSKENSVSGYMCNVGDWEHGLVVQVLKYYTSLELDWDTGGKNALKNSI